MAILPVRVRYPSHIIMIKYIEPPLEPIGPRIAVVSSSSTLLRAKAGHIIDQFDEVIRFNRSPTKGFEEYVGSRTTIQVANSHVFAGHPMKRKDWQQTNTSFIKDLRDMKVVAHGPVKGDPEKYVHESVHVYHASPKNDSKLCKDIGFRLNKQLTVGLHMIACLVSSGYKPVLFGFDLSGAPLTHYWETRGKPSGIHDNNAENDILAQLSIDKKVIISPLS